MVLTSARSAQAAGPSGVTISQVAPAYGNVGLYIERVAPTTANASPTWRVNVDMKVTAPDAHGVTLKSITTSYPGSSLSPYSYGMFRSIGAGDTLFLIVPEYRRFTFPIAPSIRFTLYFEGYDPVVVNRTLTEYKNKTPSGGYRFPASAVSGGYWVNIIGHENGPGHDTHHRGAQNQRFAYDLVVSKWNSSLSKWTDVKPGTDGSSNDEYWTFGTPLYAMADGYIRKCRRDQVDNVPGTPDATPEVEGNHLYIEHATGEVALYAHFKSGSPSTSLCPASAADNLNIFVKQGQFLGYSGNTGNSYGPHLHLHLATKKGFGTSDAPAQGVPLLFNHATTRTYTNNYGPGGAPGFASLTNSSEGALSDWSLIQPNGCGWNRVVPGGAEFARHGVKLGCYQEEFDDIALAGYRQVWRQQVDYNSQAYVASVWRPKSGLAWAARHNLTGSEYQTAFNTFTGAGYRLTHVDSYLQSGAVRYSAVFTNTTGPAWRAYHGVSAATHQSNFNTWTGQGYVPTNVSVVVVNGSRYYTALYERVSVGSFTLSSTVLESNYQTYFNQQTAAGRKLTYVDVYRDGSVNRFSVVFAQSVGSNWSAIHNATSLGYQSAYNTNTAAGRLTRAVSAYVSNGLKYAGLWRQ
ncbi:peptidoglycan DD-metalloendopeptidase family protein [Nocardioides pelophilus]|uniref:peptidoglycan DD-metalloendopeptidase family protein n=1 Tax=Nocardioides pelophilus TaxID=2172019 RepID=UPI0015FF79FC|nr:peptidoglycan DD-metalloendopeptidase family protein [Nocardioides pelophilus]